jgi:hypothetical protein
VDGAVYFTASGLKPGDAVKVNISGSEVFDLLGEKEV